MAFARNVRGSQPSTGYPLPAPHSLPLAVHGPDAGAGSTESHIVPRVAATVTLVVPGRSIAGGLAILLALPPSANSMTVASRLRAKRLPNGPRGSLSWSISRYRAEREIPSRSAASRTASHFRGGDCAGRRGGLVRPPGVHRLSSSRTSWAATTLRLAILFSAGASHERS